MDIEAQSSPWGLEPLLDIHELADYLGIPVSTIYDWRTRGSGPPAYRFGKHLKFAVGDVRDWVAQQRVSSVVFGRGFFYRVSRRTGARFAAQYVASCSAGGTWPSSP